MNYLHALMAVLRTIRDDLGYMRDNVAYVWDTSVKYHSERND